MDEMLEFVGSIKGISEDRVLDVAEALHLHFKSCEQLEDVPAAFLHRIDGLSLGEKNLVYHAASGLGPKLNIGIISFHEVAEGGKYTTYWLRGSTAKEIRRHLKNMRVAGIVDMEALWSGIMQDEDDESEFNLPVLLPDQVQFQEQNVYYVLWFPLATSDKVQLVRNLDLHKQRFLQMDDSRVASLKRVKLLES